MTRSLTHRSKMLLKRRLLWELGRHVRRDLHTTGDRVSDAEVAAWRLSAAAASAAAAEQRLPLTCFRHPR